MASKRILREGEVVHRRKGGWTADVTSSRAWVAEHVAAHPDATLQSTAEALDTTAQAVSRAVNWARDLGVFGPERPVYVDPAAWSPEDISKRTAALVVALDGFELVETMPSGRIAARLATEHFDALEAMGATREDHPFTDADWSGLRLVLAIGKGVLLHCDKTVKRSVT